MIPEPSSLLWVRVKAIYDSWLPDSEDNARELGSVLRGFGDSAFKGKVDLDHNAYRIHHAWADEAGDVMVQAISENAVQWEMVGRGDQSLPDFVEHYAALLTEVKQAIVGTIAVNEQAYQELLAERDVSSAQQFAESIAEYLRRLVGGEGPASAPKSSLLDKLGDAVGEAFDQAWDFSFGETGGPCIGGSSSLMGLGIGASACLVRDQNGDWAIAQSVTTSGTGKVPGGVIGVGKVMSNAPTVNDLSGTAVNIGVIAGFEVGGSASLDIGSDSNDEPVYAVTGVVGVGIGGTGLGVGLTNTEVTEVSPGALKDGVLAVSREVAPRLPMKEILRR